MTVIIASALGLFAFSVTLVLALGRAAALADRDAERMLHEALLEDPSPAIMARRQSHGGLARGRSARTRGYAARRDERSGAYP
jgi:hypothetical protein